MKRFGIVVVVGLLVTASAFIASGCASSVHTRSTGFDSKRVANSTLIFAPIRAVEIATPRAFDESWGSETRAGDGGKAFVSELFSKSFRHVIERGAFVYDSTLKSDSLFQDTIIVMSRDVSKWSHRKAREANRKDSLVVAASVDSSEGDTALSVFVPLPVRQSRPDFEALVAAGHKPDLSLVIMRLLLDTVTRGTGAEAFDAIHHGALKAPTISHTTRGGHRIGGLPGPAMSTQCVGDEVWIRLDYMLWDHQASAPAAFGRVDRVTDLGCFAGRGAGITRYKWLHAVDQATREIVNNTPFAGYKASGLADPLLEYEAAQEELRIHNSMDYFKAYLDKD